jgi:hypothetical protein
MTGDKGVVEISLSRTTLMFGYGGGVKVMHYAEGNEGGPGRLK